jgi:hypothetical protein
MTTKFTSQVQSRQTSVTPYFNQLHRNGNLSRDTLFSPKMTPKARQSENTYVFEMQTLENQRSTFEAFNELENLVPNGIPCEATISEMSSLLYDQDNPIIELPASRKSTITSRTNHS